MRNQQASQPIENKVKSRIYGKGRGWCFTQKDFVDLGGAAAINSAIHRFLRRDFIRQVGHGIFDYPKKHKKLGLLPPDPREVAGAIARKHAIKIQPSGAYAANLLGLSEQVPGKIVYLTDGFKRTIELGKVKIEFRKTTPKIMQTADRLSGLIIQALRFIGKENVSPNHIRRLRSKIDDEDKGQLRRDSKFAPQWIAKIILNEVIDDFR